MGGFIDKSISVDSSLNLPTFLSEFTCLSIPARPNTSTFFSLVDASKSRLVNSPSPFIVKAWYQLLQQYPDQKLHIHLIMLVRFGFLLGYTGPVTFILSANLPFALIDPSIINIKAYSRSLQQKNH